MSSFDGISAVSAASGPLVPELDRAALQPYQLVQFYNLQELRMTTPIAYREGARSAARIESTRSQPVPPAAREARTQDQPTRRLDRTEDAEPAPRLRPPRDATHSTTLRQRAADVPATGPRSRESAPAIEEAPPSAEPLPYGADPVRIRALVDEMISGVAVVPFAVYYRQAGDLVPVTAPPADKAYASVRQVNAVYKSV